MTDCTNHADVLRRLENVEDQMKCLSEKVHNVEKNAVRDAEQLKSVFVIVGELKIAITELSGKLDTIISKSGKKWEAMIDKIVASIIGALITGLAGAIFYLLTIVK